MIITIDGPAGSGKSTAARRLARALRITYLDTGATYRAVTLKALRSDADLTDEATLARLAGSMDLELHPEEDSLRVILDGADVSDEIRSEAVSRSAHHAASAPAVREVLVGLQRRIGEALGDFVTEGRDQGTVVFPDADVKFYLVADPNERARRRSDELRRRGEPADDGKVLEAILVRDQRDTGRAVGPLSKPEGAIIVDNSRFSADETLAELLRHVEARR
jgi:CMP/dCMP kinase